MDENIKCKYNDWRHLWSNNMFRKEIINPHRDDGTIVYVLQEKTLFLGDSAYGCTREGKSCYNIKKWYQ